MTLLSINSSEGSYHAVTSGTFPGTEKVCEEKWRRPITTSCHHGHFIKGIWECWWPDTPSTTSGVATTWNMLCCDMNCMKRPCWYRCVSRASWYDTIQYITSYQEGQGSPPPPPSLAAGMTLPPGLRTTQGGLERILEFRQAFRLLSPKSLPFPGGLEWSPVLWFPAMCGKAGELTQPSNQAKWVRRGFPGTLQRTAVTSIGLLGAARAEEKTQAPCKSAWVGVPLVPSQTLAALPAPKNWWCSGRSHCCSRPWWPRTSLSYLLPCRQTPAHAGEPHQCWQGWTWPCWCIQQWEDMSILTTGYSACYISTEEKKIQQLPPVCFAVTLNPCWNF